MQTSAGPGSSGGGRVGRVGHAVPASNTEEVADRRIQETFFVTSHLAFHTHTPRA